MYGGVMSVGKLPVPDSFTDGCDEGKEECLFEDGNHIEQKERRKKRRTRRNE
jgi:hypothetical protein